MAIAGKTEAVEPAAIAARSLPDAWASARALALGLVPVVATVATAAAQGGYFSTSWGWTTLAFVLAIEAWLVFSGRTDAGRAEIAFLSAFALFVAWVTTSLIWSVDPAQTVQDVERVLVLGAGVTAFVILVRRRRVSQVTLVLVAGITAVAAYGLATRLFPQHLGAYDPVAVYRLSEPIGYWNALGIFCAMGLTLALGLAAADATGLLGRAAAGVAVVILPVTLYFTFSRGGAAGAFVALAIAACVSPRRLRLAVTVLALAPVTVLAVVYASRSEALTHRFSNVAEIGDEGRRLAIVLTLLSCVQVVVTIGLAVAAKRFDAPRGVRRTAGAVLLIVLAATVAAGLVRSGGPVSMADRAYHSFVAPAAAVDPIDLNSRLTSFAGNGRVDVWSYAWHVARAHPLLGTGAGSFERDWQLNPDPPFKVRDAHSLYLETLTELGPAGLAFLLAALAVPLAVGLTVRRLPLAPYLLGAYGAFLVHAGVDWDWELGGVSLTALLIGVLMLALARGGDIVVRDRVRALAIVGAMAVGVVALVGLLGNQTLSKAQTALGARRYVEAQRQATSARTLMPWSSRPWIVLGEAQYARGDRAGALASFRHAVRVDAREWSGWIDLAVAARGRERRQALERARLLYPGSPERKGVEEDLANSRG